MENFCLYNGKKIVKPEIWDITSIELSSDYTNAIIQAESKVSTSQYNLDIVHLIENQYSEGLDSYITNTINSLTGVSSWTFDNAAKVVTYPITIVTSEYLFVNYYRVSAPDEVTACRLWAESYYGESAGSKWGATNVDGVWHCSDSDGWRNNRITGSILESSTSETSSITYQQVTSEIISKAVSGDTLAQNSIISIFNKITDDILDSDYSEFFEQNKQPK